MKPKLIQKMIDFYEGNAHDIEHFLKVYAYASLIGRLEGLDEKTQDTLEMAAIVHDISCPFCRKKYGNANGGHQQDESEALLRPFLTEFEMPEDVRERIIFLVCRHHTFSGIDGLDWQILLEADFLVNAAEESLPREAIRNFRDKIARTKAGQKLFDSIYLR